VPNFEFTALAILELLAFNAQKIKGDVTLTTTLFANFFQGSCPDFTWDDARKILSLQL